MPPDRTALMARYRGETDEVLVAALRVGPDGYSPVAWRVIEEEVSRRGLPSSTIPPLDAIPVQADPAAAPEPTLLPAWLSITLLTLASLFLLLQVVLLMGYYGALDTQGMLLPPTSSLAYGLTAWAATRFIRRGSHERLARNIGLIALLLTGIAALARIME